MIPGTAPGHPQQSCKAPAEADAAERGESREDDHSQEEANQHLDRSQFLRQVRKLCHDEKLTLNDLWFLSDLWFGDAGLLALPRDHSFARLYAKLSQQTGW
jgi:hypothetical protein